MIAFHPWERQTSVLRYIRTFFSGLSCKKIRILFFIWNSCPLSKYVFLGMLYVISITVHHFPSWVHFAWACFPTCNKHVKLFIHFGDLNVEWHMTFIYNILCSLLLHWLVIEREITFANWTWNLLKDKIIRNKMIIYILYNTFCSCINHCQTCLLFNFSV